MGVAVHGGCEPGDHDVEAARRYVNGAPRGPQPLARYSCRRAPGRLERDARAAQRAALKVDVVTEIEIARPRHEVAGYAADPTKAPAWYSNIQSIRWLTDPPVRIGSRMTFIAHFLGRRLEYTYEVVDLAPGERLVMRTADGPFAMETTYTWA